MNELANKRWNYRLWINAYNQYVMSVLCGTVGLYEVEVKLTESQIGDYEARGENMLDELAEVIRNNPENYSQNHGTTK